MEHNLGIQIERYNPQIAQFNLESAYAYYDPIFKSHGGHAFDRGHSPDVSGVVASPFARQLAHRFD